MEGSGHVELFLPEPQGTGRFVQREPAVPGEARAQQHHRECDAFLIIFLTVGVHYCVHVLYNYPEAMVTFLYI